MLFHRATLDEVKVVPCLTGVIYEVLINLRPGLAHPRVMGRLGGECR
jgi:hypothetical protein